jgi:Cu/Ag efflux protein CusF
MHNGTARAQKFKWSVCFFAPRFFVLFNTAKSGAHTMKTFAKFLFFIAFVSVLSVCSSIAQQTAQEGAPRPHRQGGQVGDLRSDAFGEVTEISGSTLKIKLPSGAVGTVNTTADTRFRKDEQDAKLSDFKVGDRVFVRGESTGENTWTATAIGSAPSQAQIQERMKEAMGKTMVVGEVESIEAPKLTIRRTDGVEQTIEADESTSFRRGREESITLPDIKPGDTVFARGELKNGVFVPASISVLDPEMVRRMKERGGMIGFGGGFGRGSGQGQRPENSNSGQQAPPPQVPK